MFQENTLALNTCTTRYRRNLVAFVLICVVFIVYGCGTLVRHQVETGDSLYSIGFYYGQDYRDIAKWNDIPPPYVIHKGQWLRVAPPDEKWWAERKQRRKEQSQNSKKSSATVKRAGGTKPDQKRRVTQAAKSKRRVVTEDFTDKNRKISSWVWPTKGQLLNADKQFSKRNKGIDIAGKRGQAVYAAATGKVVYSGSGLIGYGKLIIIKHNKTYLSAYAHNEKILVKEGDIVKRGQTIARMGRTPDNHIQLHFEIRRNGKPVDPLRFLKR